MYDWQSETKKKKKTHLEYHQRYEREESMQVMLSQQYFTLSQGPLVFA